MIRASNVVIRRGARTVIDHVSMDVDPGEIVVLAGPNGSGKSTFVGAITGDLPIASGAASISDRGVGETAPLEMARLRAVMTQHTHVAFGFTVREVVWMGRAPWRNAEEDDESETAVAQALTLMDLDGLSERPVQALSGGELARVAMARTLAQQTPTIILDEPTASLDLKHQVLLLQRVTERVRSGCAALVVLHDLTLAAMFADRIALLGGGRVAAIGSPGEVLTPTVLSAVYDIEVSVIRDSPVGHPVVVPSPN